MTNTLDALITNVDVRDLLPPGFVYRGGSAMVAGTVLEPMRAGRTLTWADQSFAPKERRVYKLVLVVGAGVSEGEVRQPGVRAQQPGGGEYLSNVATAAVRVVPDPLFGDCSDIVGKVFDDKNVNGYQDSGEVWRAQCSSRDDQWRPQLTTDAEGRYHIACAAVPNEYRGSRS